MYPWKAHLILRSFLRAFFFGGLIFSLAFINGWSGCCRFGCLSRFGFCFFGSGFSLSVGFAFGIDSLLQGLLSGFGQVLYSVADLRLFLFLPALEALIGFRLVKSAFLDAA